MSSACSGCRRWWRSPRQGVDPELREDLAADRDAPPDRRQRSGRRTVGLENRGDARNFKVETRRSDRDFPLEFARDQPRGGRGRPPGHRIARAHERARFHGERAGAQGKRAGLHGQGTGLGRPARSDRADGRMVLLSGGIDSPVAAWLMMRRGSRPDFVHFYSGPQRRRSRRRQDQGTGGHPGPVLAGAPEAPPGAGGALRDALHRRDPRQLRHGHVPPLHDQDRRQPGLPATTASAWSPATAWARWPARPCTTWRHQLRRHPAHPAPAGRHGQDGDHRLVPEDRGLRDLHPALPRLLLDPLAHGPC